MTETPSSIPEESRVEAAARIAAEAVVAALLPRLTALEEREQEPVPPAVPDALLSRIDGMENALQLALQPAPVQPAVLSDEDRKTLDDLRKGNAENARNIKHILDKENS